MPGAGWTNPFPLQFGGGTTSIDDVYSMLRSAVGKGGASVDDDSLESIWRQCKARVIAAVGGFDERAALQAFPNLASDLLPYYERTLIDRRRSAGETDDERRARVTARWTDELGGNVAALETALQEIDSRFTIVAVTESDTTTTVFGRWLEDLAGTEPFNGGRSATLFPNYSTEFILTALLTLGGGGLDLAAQRSLAEGRDFLADNLPAHIGIQMATDVDGFELGIDVLDYTVLTGG